MQRAGWISSSCSSKNRVFFKHFKCNVTHRTEWQKQCNCRVQSGRRFSWAVGRRAPCHPCQRPARWPSATGRSPSCWNRGRKLSYSRQWGRKVIIDTTYSYNVAFHTWRAKLVGKSGAKSLNKQPTRLKECRGASTERTTAGFPRGLIKNTQAKSN